MSLHIGSQFWFEPELDPILHTSVVSRTFGVPVQLFAVLHVEQHGRDQLVHVLRLPDDGLELVVHRLPHHSLQTFDPGHPDPDKDTQKVDPSGRGTRIRTTDKQRWTDMFQTGEDTFDK